MKPNPALLGLLGALWLASCASSPEPEPARLEATAARVTITRDDWGIAHVHGFPPQHFRPTVTVNADRMVGHRSPAGLPKEMAV